MNFLKLFHYLIKLILKKLFRKKDFNNPRWFPINNKGTNLEGFDKAIFPDKYNSGYFVRFYKTDFAQLKLINFVLDFSKEFFFKFEIIKGKVFRKKIQVKSEDDSLLPLASVSDNIEKIELSSEKEPKILGLLPNRFTYLKLEKDKEYNFQSNNNFFVGEPMLTKKKSENKYNNVLMLFLDGITLFKNKNENFYNHCPNIKKFFDGGVKFNRNFCNAEWTLPSFPSHFTGLRQQNHGFYHNKKFHIFRDDIKVLPELFKEKNYMNLFLNSNPRANPRYGYIRGFDRTIHKLNYEFDDMCNDLDEHLNVFKGRDNFIMMNVFDFHTTDKGAPSFENQSKLNLDYLRKYTSLKFKKKSQIKTKKYDQDNIEIEKYLIDLERIDRIFLRLTDIINRYSKNSKSLVTLVTDHGNPYTENTTDLLSEKRMRVPWMIKGDDIQPMEINYFTENVDTFSSMIKICNLNNTGNSSSKFSGHFTGENNTDSILPPCLGGQKKRDFVFMQSIYDNDPYFAKILDDNMEFTMKSKKIKSNGLIDLDGIEQKIKLLDGSKANVEKEGKYKKYCLDQINNWNESISQEKFNYS
jgi:hypothetical protein